MTKTIEIEEFGIIIDLDSDDFSSYGAWATGKITSTMHKEEMISREDYTSFSRNYNDELTSRSYYNAIIDSIEATILTHAIEGLDVTNDKYLLGIRAAIKVAEREYE